MFRPRPRSGHPQLFSSAKTASPVPARHVAVREALVHASLDPVVRAISYITQAHAGSPQVVVDIDAIVLTRDDGRFALDVVPARQVRDIDDEGLVLIALRELGLPSLVVTAEDLKREPHRSNCGIVWSYRGRVVPVGLRISILQTLRDDGPMTLGRLLESLRADSDPTPAVMSVACDDLVELDLASAPLGPETPVRSRT